MKKLLPADTVIAPKPAGLEEYNVRADEIQRLADLGQEKELTACTQRYNEELANGTRKRKHVLDPNLEGMMKRMGRIAMTNQQGAHDTANPDEPVLTAADIQ